MFEEQTGFCRNGVVLNGGAERGESLHSHFQRCDQCVREEMFGGQGLAVVLYARFWNRVSEQCQRRQAGVPVEEQPAFCSNGVVVNTDAERCECLHS